jgi:hypothetical protein
LANPHGRGGRAARRSYWYRASVKLSTVSSPEKKTGVACSTNETNLELATACWKSVVGESLNRGKLPSLQAIADAALKTDAAIKELKQNFDVPQMRQALQELPKNENTKQGLASLVSAFRNAEGSNLSGAVADVISAGKHFALAVLSLKPAGRASSDFAAQQVQTNAASIQPPVAKTVVTQGNVGFETSESAPPGATTELSAIPTDTPEGLFTLGLST